MTVVLALMDNEWTTRISPTGVLSWTPSTYHIFGDFVSSVGIGLLALGVGDHWDVDLMQDIGPAAVGAEAAPAGDGGQSAALQVEAGQRQTDGADVVPRPHLAVTFISTTNCLNPHVCPDGAGPRH